mmetsp:Transcript_18052/g.40038  ORF Transcript_18052/g.40038 Transcript_18052/m.40038 type:complete len:682 (+) Transcript_18052:208-2253(+)
MSEPPPAGLFGDDSSSSSEDDEAPAPPEATGAEGSNDNNDGTAVPMDVDDSVEKGGKGAEAAGGEDGDAAGDEGKDIGEDKPAAAAASAAAQRNAALFGDDDSSSDEEEDDKDKAADDAEVAAPAKTDADAGAAAATGTTADEADPAAAPAPAPAAKSNSGLFGDDEDDSSDSSGDEIAFDDVKGRAATDAERAAMSQRAEALASKSAIPGRSSLDDGADDANDGSQLGTLAQGVRGSGGDGGDDGESHPLTAEELSQQQQRRMPRRVEVLDIPRPPQIHHSSKLSLHVAKLPNLVGMQPKPYDPETFDAEQEDKDYRGYTHSMIRWRYKKKKKNEKKGGKDESKDDDDDDEDYEYARDENNKLIRESNARFVKWSDGSYTLHVGPDVFEVDQIGAPKGAQTATTALAAAKAGTPAAEAAAAAAAAAAAGGGGGKTKSKAIPPGTNGYVYLTHTIRAAQSETDGTPLPSLINTTILECQGPITSKLVPRPSSLHSAAHKNLTLAVRQRNMKKARIAEVVTVHDPELEKARRIRNKDDMAKQAARRGRRGGGRRSSAGGGRPGMNRRYLEEDEDDDHYDSVNVSRMKRRAFDRDASMDYGTSSGEEEDEWSKRKRLGVRSSKRGKMEASAAAAAAAVESSSGEEEFMDFGDDDDDEEDNVMIASKAGAKKRAHQAIADDDDD